MRTLDRILQNWRIAKARPFIKKGARVLDVGSSDGTLFLRLGPHIAGGMGIDPTLKETTSVGSIPLIAGYFPKDMPSVEPFDAITMLAVLEHFPEASHADVSNGCTRFLKPGGRLIITVPAPAVDQILKVLKAVHLVDGMSLEEHHGYDIRQTATIFPAPNFRLLAHKPFQFGLNHLFVFESNA